MKFKAALPQTKEQQGMRGPVAFHDCAKSDIDVVLLSNIQKEAGTQPPTDCNSREDVA
jgi:hypothetical protein